jgi:hypothetical protein
MKRIFLFLSSCILFFNCISQTAVPSSDTQIRLALLAAPEDKRDGAAVYGYSGNKDFVLLRKGTNELVCVADDPSQAGFSAACYHRDLDSFMQRGRDLRKQGKTNQEIFAAREKEVSEGKLIMPRQPTTLYVFSAPEKDYNISKGEVNNGYLRYVVYIPYATAESTGLPLKPEGPGMPWIMHPGTHGAHIMINPPAKQ